MTEEKREEALQIALEGGAVERCPIHKDYLYDTGDPTTAYKVANRRFTDGELRENWESRQELTDAIKQIGEEAGIDVCPSCMSF